MGAGAAVWIALASLAPLEHGQRLPAGLYPAARIVEAYAAATRLEVSEVPTALGELPVWVNAPIPLTADHAWRLEIRLNAAGAYLARGPERVSVVSSPRVPEPGRPDFRIRVVSVEHLDPERFRQLTRLLQGRIDAREAEVPEAERTVAIPDARTQKIVLRYRNLDMIKGYIAWIEGEDTPPPPPALALTSYSCRFTRADWLIESFEKEWKKQGHPPVSVIPHLASNSVLVRAPRPQLSSVEELLRKLDRRP